MVLSSMMSPGANTSQLGSRDFKDEQLREHGLLPHMLDFSTAHASKLPTLINVEHADASEYQMICQNSTIYKFGGLLQAHTS